MPHGCAGGKRGIAADVAGDVKADHHRRTTSAAIESVPCDHPLTVFTLGILMDSSRPGAELTSLMGEPRHSAEFSPHRHRRGWWKIGVRYGLQLAAVRPRSLEELG